VNTQIRLEAVTVPQPRTGPAIGTLSGDTLGAVSLEALLAQLEGTSGVTAKLALPEAVRRTDGDDFI
jgi:hypothetical protein